MSEKEKRELLEAIAGISKDEHVTITESDFTHAMAWSVTKELDEIEALGKREGAEPSAALLLAITVSNASVTHRAWKLLTGKIKEEDEDE